MKNSIFIFFMILTFPLVAQPQVGKWMKFEHELTSSELYDNPVCFQLRATLTAPSGREIEILGFWDGGKLWKIRFSPDEIGTWTFQTDFSDEDNDGLHQKEGSFECVPNQSNLEIYKRGPVKHPKGSYHLSYQDGTPFFWVACTAWNGALKSTDEEWDTYLQHRKDHHYNVIQFVTTQWRGADQNAEGQVAYEGTGRIRINPEFFKRIDQKIDRINEFGLIAAPVLLWALPFGDGRELSPGYALPDNEAIVLANYIVARYGGNQVVWILGGDGKYTDELEDRWKYIGRSVFGKGNQYVVTTHPMGSSWYGDIYADEPWIDLIGYQSSHNNQARVVNWINKGPMSQQWNQLPPRPLINMEPNYEEIHFKIDAEDVRNASYWSIFATPPAGITYGANGIWPWIRPGETILNHRHDPGTSSWRESINFPGSLQIGYLSEFINQYEWWKLTPSQEILVEQPGDQQFNHFISVVKNDDSSLIMAYLPVLQEIKIYNPDHLNYEGQWFDPVNNVYLEATLVNSQGIVSTTPPSASDHVLILKKVN
ncbi:MAG: apiosidase-like domain-containing protein [Candidatus Cyclobacteriaceae bacterium M3_2C_046]